MLKFWTSEHESQCQPENDRIFKSLEEDYVVKVVCLYIITQKWKVMYYDHSCFAFLYQSRPVDDDIYFSIVEKAFDVMLKFP